MIPFVQSSSSSSAWQSESNVHLCLLASCGRFPPKSLTIPSSISSDSSDTRPSDEDVVPEDGSFTTISVLVWLLLLLFSPLGLDEKSISQLRVKPSHILVELEVAVAGKGPFFGDRIGVGSSREGKTKLLQIVLLLTRESPPLLLL